MRALTLTDSGPRLRDDYPMPRPAPHEALIRVSPRPAFAPPILN